MLPRAISSDETFGHKFIISGVFLGAVGMLLGIFLVWPLLTQQPFYPPGILFALAWSSLAVPIIFWTTVPLKVVRMDDQNLYISNYRRTITVPRASIARVEKTYGMKLTLIEITFTAPTPFGPNIRFIPHPTFAMSELTPAAPPR